jgi:hypothetical protein
VSDTRKPSPLYWTISAVLLVWALGGASIYVAYFVETPEQFASTAEIAANRDAYANYIANIPVWAIAIGMIAAGARLVGAIGLVLQRAWAAPFFVVSLAFFLAALFRGFILADATRVMNPAHIAVEFIFVGLGLFAIWFAYHSKAKGALA